MTLGEAYDEYTSLWLINPKELRASVVGVADSPSCSNCEKMFGNELVYEIHREGTHIYDVYCWPCANEKKIDFYSAECQIVIET